MNPVVRYLLLCDDAKGRRRLAEHAQHTAWQRFDAMVMTKRIETLYRELLAR